MNPHAHLIKGLLLPELELNYVKKISQHSFFWITNKTRCGAVCPKCACFSNTIYDKRCVKIRDNPISGKGITLIIKKKRYYCKRCKKPFTEPVPGILPKRRSTQRLRRSIQWASLNFADLKKVCRTYACSPGFVYKVFYEQLELENRKRNSYSFGHSIGIDEHVFGRKKGVRKREFVTMLVDHQRKKLREVALGKSHAQLHDQFKDIPGRENVKLVTLDMSDSYKSFAKTFFFNAELVADRFHVQRLIQPVLAMKRIEITGDKRKNPVRILMNRNRRNLKPYERSALDVWLNNHPEINEVYNYKEAIARLYEIRGYGRAQLVFDKLIERLKISTIPEIKTLTATLSRWRTEILNYFKYRITNARVEGFNNVAKVIKRRAYGFRSFENYRLRLLNACS